MQKPDLEKIKSEHKPLKRTVAKAALVTTAVVVLLVPFFIMRPATVTLRADGVEYELDIATSEAAQQRGLGGREVLAQDEGMLFIFDKPAVRCMWMKDMLFPTDMIWLDSTKKVTYIAPNVTPDSYPQQYCGDESTKYVIELNAGEAKRADIRTGQTLKL